MSKFLTPTDTINVTIAGHLITWIATRTVTLYCEGGPLLDEIITHHKAGTLLPVFPPLSWCERFSLWARSLWPFPSKDGLPK